MTELKSRIVAPPGFGVLGGDVGAQEMGLAHMLADVFAGGFIGASPMTHQVLAGNKDNFSDAHSTVAYELFLKDEGYVIQDKTWYIEEDEGTLTDKGYKPNKEGIWTK